MGRRRGCDWRTYLAVSVHIKNNCNRKREIKKKKRYWDLENERKKKLLTVFIQEVVLEVLAEESLYGLADLLLLLQNVLVILRVVPLGDSWQRVTESVSAAPLQCYNCF